MAIACLSILLTSALQQPQPPLLLNRRSALQGLAGFAAAAPSAAAFASPALDGYDPASAVTRPAAGRNFFPPLTPPLTNRATYRYELGRDAWALEQLLTFANVSATVRTVVIKLKDGSKIEIRSIDKWQETRDFILSKVEALRDDNVKPIEAKPVGF